MDLTEQQKRGQEILFRIISEAWEDENFKQALLKNPEETLNELFGNNFSTPKPVKVTDQSDPEYIYINIPVKPQRTNKVAAKKKSGEGTDDQEKFSMTDYQTLYELLGQLNQ